MSNKLSLGVLLFSIAFGIVSADCANKKKETHNERTEDTTSILMPSGDAAKDNGFTEASDKESSSKSIQPDSVVAFARTLIGTPYLYASTDPSKGFDCSGFITYIFNHFNSTVPRSSVDFTRYGKEIAINKAKPGDLILFTGTDSKIRIVGHMGIVESIKGDRLQFIHSTSGKMKGVVITAFGDYYRNRFIKVIRVFQDEFFQ